MIHRLKAKFAVAFAAALVSATTAAQQYPTKPIRMVMGFTAGGGVDIMARLLTPRMSDTLGQPIILEARPGAGTNIAMEYVIKSPPDGYTLLINTPPVSINMSLYKNLGFDTTRDLAAVSVFSQSPNVLIVHPSVPAKSVKELVALARAKPDALKFSSGSNGTTQHLSGELFKLRTQTRMLHVPYRGTTQSLTALIGGEVELNFATVASASEYVKAGRLRPLGTTTAARTALMQQVPTMRESGVDMIVTVTYSLHAPGATSRDIVNKLADAVIRAARAPETRQRLLDIGAEPVGYTHEEATRWLREEVSLWAAVVKAAKITVD